MDKNGRWKLARSWSRVNTRASVSKSGMIPEEGTHEEHGSLLVDSSGHDEGPRGFSEEAGLRGVQKAPKTVHAGEGR